MGIFSQPPPAPGGDSEIAPGTLLGRYLIVSVLGRGGMGVVYKAYDSQLDRPIAIKILRPELAGAEDTDDMESRMLREAQAMARLTHPNVVAVHDVGTFEHRVFLAMDFVDGCTLKEWLTRKPPWREVHAVLLAAGRGLEAAHRAGLVHRDFKPDNVLIGNDGRVLVTDFGLARADEPLPAAAARPRRILAEHAPVSGTRGSTMGLSSPLTLTGSVLGTIGYMAPEQAFGEPTNASTDQFSYCVTAYLAFWGARPFPGDDLGTYLAAVNTEPAVPAAGDVPGWLLPVVTRGLSPRPEDRFPSMGALLEALARDPEAPKRARRFKVFAGIAGAGLLAVALGFVARPSHVCDVPPSELAGVWDDAVRGDIVRALRSGSAVEKDDRVARVLRVLDGTSAAWIAMRRDSCEATRVAHRQSEETNELRMHCLDRRRTELGALTSVLRRADGETASRALDAVYGLTRVSSCADVQGLKAAAGLPDDPKAREIVLRARDDLALARSLQLAGKPLEARSASESALKLARASGAESTVAEALYAMGDLSQLASDYAGAEPLLAEATWTASGAGADTLVAQASSLQGFVVGAKLQRPEEAHVWLAAAEAAVKRLGGSEALEIEVLQQKAMVLSEAEWRPDLALEIKQRILPAYERIYGTHPKTLRAVYSLGVTESYLGHHAEATPLYERAVAMATEIGGPDYIWIAHALYGVGDSLVAEGKLEPGEAALARALQIYDAARDHYMSAATLEVLVRSALRAGDVPRAVSLARRSLALVEKAEGAQLVAPMVRVTAARAFVAAGAFAEAEPLCTSALAAEDAHHDLEPAKVVGWDALLCQSEVMVGTGRVHEAIPLLERSLTLQKRIYPEDLPRAELLLAQSIVKTKGDLARARALAEAAERALAEHPFLSGTRRAVEEWVSTTL
jgi:tetratricopeptide (TPR) repeat protein